MKFLSQKLVLPGGSEIEGPQEISDRFPNLAAIINKLLPMLFAAAGLILFFFLIAGGFDLLTSGGDPKKAESAKGKLTNAIIGFIIIFVAWWLTQILARIFGLEGL